MMTLQQAITAAQSTPSGTPEFHSARELCMIRGFDPDGFASMHGLPPMHHWQRVIAEVLLEQELRDAMMGPATVGLGW